MQSRHPDAYQFLPKTYVLPEDWKRLRQCEGENDCELLIIKPLADSCGRGIHVVNNINQIPNNKSYVVSKYISNPYLINKLKFDLRLYVLVTSYEPLKVYFYSDGLTRFATNTYEPEKGALDDRFMHLTNYSVNKFAPKFQPNTSEDADDQGSKWSWLGLKRHLEQQGIHEGNYVPQIKDTIIKTLISAETYIKPLLRFTPSPQSCFELYGFDIMFDDHLKPWLIEVNISPSLTQGSPLDRKVKSGLLNDVVSIVHPEPPLPHFESGSEQEIFALLDREYERKGDFELIFPCLDGEKYFEYFESHSKSNELALKWLQNMNRK
eukprot:c8361_g1_i2.p1 GENE.c8361_g1_i2~~c8361_g1_i2.p1  ORF type:complete len:322 (+),score=50.25 c8361_g1_i2:333-1298(+)